MRGPRVDYLRGAVLDEYAGGRWVRSSATADEKRSVFEDAATPEDGVKVTAVSETTGRFFLPLAARALTTTPASVRVDGAGSVKRVGDHGLEGARFAIGPRDKAIPSRARRRRLADPPLGPRARAGARRSVDRGRDDAGREARRHRAALQRGVPVRALRSEPSRGPDPVLDFLFANKSGHCEYFATGMVLLARAAGIPARFVAGYRVAERTPFGYHVVRERNAHAWVEAWIAGEGWTTRDPTPESELPQNREHRSSFLASLSDGLRVGWEDLDDWLQARTLEQTTVAWAVGFAVLVWIIARGVRRRGASGSGARDDEAPLPCFEVLLATLAQSGVGHDGREPIERLAARAPDRDAARLLERYAALRYGGVGDPDALAGDVAAYARRHRSRPRATLGP